MRKPEPNSPPKTGATRSHWDNAKNVLRKTGEVLVSLLRGDIHTSRRLLGKTYFLLRAIKLFLLIFMLGLILLTVNGLNETLEPCDVAVVPGTTAFSPTRVSKRLAARLDQAIVLYRKGLCKKIIVSGGTDPNQVSEAVAMRYYLRKHSIPEKDIIMDEHGNNTRQTAIFAAQYMQQHKLTKAYAVTQFFHAPRTALALRQEGVPTVLISYARYHDRKAWLFLGREAIAYVCYFLHIK